MCFGCGKEPSHGNGETVLLSTQDKCLLLRNQVSQLEGVDWRVDYIISSSQLKDINEPSVQLKLKVKNTDTGVVEPVSFNIASDKFRVLLNELKQADSIMDNLASS